MRKTGNKRRGQIGRWAAIGCVGALVLLGLLLGGGLRINGSKSFPVGLYMATAKRQKKGIWFLLIRPRRRYSSLRGTGATWMPGTAQRARAH
jgi:type IV secretory pathway protease TraF